MKELLHHLFVPRQSNNHRARLLHHKSLLLVISGLLVLQLFFGFFKTNQSSVLGVGTNISSEELLRVTNQRRQELGLKPLTLSQDLTNAAALKAQDMFGKDYWAHNGPDGTPPWVFFRKVNYDYIYAGENLARGFSESDDIVNAWMASPSHRENMLSNNYEEIGFAVVDGRLSGEDTTLVVELFGQKSRPAIATKGKTTDKKVSVSKPKNAAGKKALGAVVKPKPLIDLNAMSKNISSVILMLFISVLVLDMIIVERKQIIRLVGHNTDHSLYLLTILMLVLLFSKAFIL